MGRAPIPLNRVLRASLALAAPLAVVLAVLVGLGELKAGPALLAFLALALPAFLIALFLLGEFAALGRYIDQLIHQGGAPPPRIHLSETARELAYAVERLNRSWAERTERLASEAGQLERVLDALPDPLLLLDGARRVVRANVAANDLFGEGLVGRDLAIALRNPAVLEAIEAAHKAGRGRSVAFSLGPPVERVFLARIEPRALSAAAEEMETILALHDLTEVKRSEQMRADFVANASHEIRTPLSSLIGFIETLRGPALDDAEARERFLAVMEEQATRMTRLVDDLLSLSRIEVHEHRPPTGRVGLAALLEGVRSDLQWQADLRRVTIELDAPDDLPAVLGDADELAQVFHNLVDNAVKYGREGGRVVVTARALDRSPPGLPWRPAAALALSVAVADEGEGIAREHIPRLTERFYRVDTARSRELGGTGLGLAIVKHIVNRHRGWLAVESKTGEGSVFTVYLQTAPEKDLAQERA